MTNAAPASDSVYVLSPSTSWDTAAISHLKRRTAQSRPALLLLDAGTPTGHGHEHTTQKLLDCGPSCPLLPPPIPLPLSFHPRLISVRCEVTELGENPKTDGRETCYAWHSFVLLPPVDQVFGKEKRSAHL